MASVLERLRYVLAVFFVIGLPPAIGWWFLIHPLVGWWRRLGARVTMSIMAIFLLGSMAALFPFRDALLARDLGFHPLAALAGLPLLVASALIARQRKKHLTFRILAGAPEVSREPGDSKLLTEGSYRRIRHPRYVEFVLGGCGWALVLGYLGLYVMMAAVALAIHAIVLLEERELRERFGPAYADYAARVPRYVPRRE